ncbi:MAG: lipoprotein N-acyltransferase Lnb domain-containing protein [Bdellovibrio sp.]
MRFLVFFILIFNFFLFDCFASTLVKNDDHCKCKNEINDSFEEPLAYNFGPYKNQCVDSCRYRRVRFLDKNFDNHLVTNGDYWQVANILHNKQYWIAKVPINKVAQISVGFEEFAPRIAHMFLRFHFSDKVFLYPQVKNKTTKPVSIQDLVFSAEAAPPKDNHFEFLNGLMDRYLLAFRVLSIEEMYDWMVTFKKHTVRQYPVSLSADERKQVLKNGLEASMNQSFETAYNLLGNNCATSSMDLIEKVSPPQKKDFLSKLLDFQRRLPVRAFVSTVFYMESLNLIDSKRHEMKNLEDEF